MHSRNWHIFVVWPVKALWLIKPLQVIPRSFYWLKSYYYKANFCQISAITGAKVGKTFRQVNMLSKTPLKHAYYQKILTNIRRHRICTYVAWCSPCSDLIVYVKWKLWNCDIKFTHDAQHLILMCMEVIR